MDLDTALRYGRALLDAHGLHDWRLHLDHARQRCGACHFHRREITLSKHFVQMNEVDEIEATVLHEIAHALSGPGAGHGPVWQDIARRIGAPVQATNDRAAMPQPRWHLLCLNCESVLAQRHRRSLDLARVRCRACGIELGRVKWEAAGPS